MDDEEILKLWNSSDAGDDKEMISHIDLFNIANSSVQALQRVDEANNFLSSCLNVGKMSQHLDHSRHKLSNSPRRNSMAARQA